MSNHTTALTAVQIPAHLRQFVVAQEYEKYTAIDQAVWRYVLRQNSAFLAEKGYGDYYEGLRMAGMSVEKIPDVAEMQAQMAGIGWSAVAIDGFIPPVAFFDFQAHGILPVACDIRTLENIAYTPAPDIIHETAGHAPMLSIPAFGEFVKQFGEIGAHALSSKEDLDVYEAIRLLSILKEDATASEDQIAAAEAELERALAAVTSLSEATMISRLYWWTVEYGLVGSLEDPKIYGAGLLSSMGESRSCLGPQVEKIPFDLDVCINTDFNITKPQPQLFVCRDFDQLLAAVEEFAGRMAYRVGGTESLVKALNSANTATMVYSSGLQVSGTLTELEFDAAGEAVYLKTTGESALAVGRRELPGHDKSVHAEGFGSPIGLLKGCATPLEVFTDAMLQEAGLVVGQPFEKEFESGVIIRGVLDDVLRHEGKIILLTVSDCTVTLGDKVLFHSEWGAYHMAVGARITSVFAGAADREKFHASLQPSKTVTVRSDLNEDGKRLNDLYQTVRNLRESSSGEALVVDVVSLVLHQLEIESPQEWLLRLEMLEILTERHLAPGLQRTLREQLNALAEQQEGKRGLIENGLKLLGK